ncbi:hypothetical protein FNV43_RR09999 [Rhamnella rubrinervis]|uniref:Hepatoma-derived growth factor-related protein 2-like n=1 Tax=Rhamnella rubrinervis TaxID=2594499 RepID=A0A8K0MKB0_9ROSA|nr:hypothetical protein FNV43_RR09999 [Rhamnella rubrinervis]
MADFSFLSDTDESAVDELISQTQDLCVLEQVSAINCSSFVDSLLPTDLESRFRKLKSFPVTNSKPKVTSFARNESAFTSRTEFNISVKGEEESDSLADEDSEVFSPSKQTPDKKMSFKPKPQPGHLSLPKPQPGHPSLPLDSKDFSAEKDVFSPSKENSASSNSPTSWLENEILSASKRNPKVKTGSDRKSKTGSFSSPLGSSNSLMDSPSPPKKAGCFWCSPKKNSFKKSKENHASGALDLDWSTNDELLSDLGTFSTKKQQRILKKAMKEEEKISREAEKIVKWAKQASGRMVVSDIEDELSDD